MNASTSPSPASPVIAPIRIASLPRSAPTVRSSIACSGTGSEPARSRAASDVVSLTENAPLIWPEPPVIGS